MSLGRLRIGAAWFRRPRNHLIEQHLQGNISIPTHTKSSSNTSMFARSFLALSSPYQQSCMTQSRWPWWSKWMLRTGRGGAVQLAASRRPGCRALPTMHSTSLAENGPSASEPAGKCRGLPRCSLRQAIKKKAESTSQNPLPSKESRIHQLTGACSGAVSILALSLASIAFTLAAPDFVGDRVLRFFSNFFYAHKKCRCIRQVWERGKKSW